jgi:hypothetical protein
VGDRSYSDFEMMSDSEKLYQSGLAQAIDKSVSKCYRISFLIPLVAMLFRCLDRYGAGLESHLLIIQP